MGIDVPALLQEMSTQRPVFHSEADFQHEVAWRIHLAHPDAQIRIQTRPEPRVRLDLQVTLGAERVAVEVKYLTARFRGVVAGEGFDLDNKSAQVMSRHDFIKDITRIESFVAYGIVESGWAIVLTNDGSYWRPGSKADPVDAMFRTHEGRVLEGSLSWGPLAALGTTRRRDTPLVLRGSYPCVWRTYSTIARQAGPLVEFRYLAFEITP